MHIKFSKEVTYLPEFEGDRDLPPEDQITAKLQPMELGELLDLREAFTNAGFEQGSVEQMTSKQMRAVLSQAGFFIPKYAKLEGNANFTLDDIVRYAPFFGLAIELLFQLLSISSPNQDDEKNS